MLALLEMKQLSFRVFLGPPSSGAGELGEPLKVDVLLPLASARLVLHPREDLYNVAFEQNSDMPLDLS